MAAIAAVFGALTTLRNGYEGLRAAWGTVSNVLVVPEEISKLDQQMEIMYRRIEKLLGIVEDEAIVRWLTAEDIGLLEAYCNRITPLYTELSEFMRTWTRRLPRGNPGQSVDAVRLLQSVHWDLAARQKAERMFADLKTQVSDADEIFERTVQSRKIDAIGRNQEYLKELLEMLLLHVIRENRGAAGRIFNRRSEAIPGSAGTPAETSDPRRFLANLQTAATPGAGAQTATPISEEGLHLMLSVESPNAEISITLFLVKLAQMSSEVCPWNNRVLSSARYPKGTAQYEIYGLMCDLMEMSGGHRWGSYSVQSWLTMGSWYLSAVLHQFGDRGPRSTESVAKIYNMLLKVFWVVLTVDQHPLKPTEEDDDSSHEWLQYQNLVMGLTHQIELSQSMVDKVRVKDVVDSIQQYLHDFWTFDMRAMSDVEVQAMGARAARLRESPPLCKTYTPGKRRGQFDPLCPNACIILPRVFEYMSSRPILLACSCRLPIHNRKLNQLCVSGTSTAVAIPNTDCVQVKGLVPSEDNIEVSEQILMIDTVSKDESDKLLKLIESVVLRLQTRSAICNQWNIGSVEMPKELRFVRSSFDQAVLGAPFVKVVKPPPPPKYIEKLVHEKITVAKPQGLWSWLLGFEQEKEEQLRVSRVLTKVETEKPPRPVDTTTTRAIGPFALRITKKGQTAEGFSIQLLSITSSFELTLCLASELRFKVDTQTQLRLSLVIPSGTTTDTLKCVTDLTISLTFASPQDVLEFQRHYFLAKNYGHLEFYDNPTFSSSRSKVIWRGELQSSPLLDGQTITRYKGRTHLLLLSTHGGNKMRGLIWNTDSMSIPIVFEVSRWEAAHFMYATSPSTLGFNRLRMAISTLNDPRRLLTKDDDESRPKSRQRSPGYQLLIEPPQHPAKVSVNEVITATHSPQVGNIELGFIDIKDCANVRYKVDNNRLIHYQCKLRSINFAPESPKIFRKLQKDGIPELVIKDAILEVATVGGGRGRVMDVWVPEPQGTDSGGAEYTPMQLQDWKPLKEKQGQHRFLLTLQKAEFSCLGRGVFVNDGARNRIKGSWRGSFFLNFRNPTDCEATVDAFLGLAVSSRAR